MIGKKGIVFAVALFFVAVLSTGQARLALDNMTASFRNDFREMLYLPRGDALKILACGFDAPLADALFIKSLIYYAEAMAAKGNRSVRRDYAYALFDVITDLSPRFTRAYQIGSLLLSASGTIQANRAACGLLDKGVRISGTEAKAGRPFVPEPRWLFHIILANIYETSLQTLLRRDGDLAGAADARQAARREFHLAATAPEAPVYVQEAAAGYLRLGIEGRNIEDSLLAILSVWRELRDLAARRGDEEVRKDMEERAKATEERLFAIRITRDIEADLSRAGKRYLAERGRPPVTADDLLRAGLISGLPVRPLETEDFGETWLVLPDGSFKSRLLADLETDGHLDYLRNAVVDYVRDNQKMPAGENELREKRYLGFFPEPPLKALGQIYVWDRNRGFFSSMPEGPEPPPVGDAHDGG